MGDNFKTSASALNFTISYGNSIQFECSLDQKFAVSLIPLKLEAGFSTEMNITPVYKMGYSALASAIKKVEKDYSVQNKKCSDHLFFSVSSGVTPNKADLNETGGDQKLTVAGKNYIEFIAGHGVFKNNPARVLENFAPAISAAGMAAGGIASVVCGNKNVLGIAAAVIATLGPALSYLNLIGKGGGGDDPLVTKMDELETSQQRFDIGSYTDDNMTLHYGKTFSVSTKKSKLTIDNKKNEINFKAAQKLSIGVNNKAYVQISGDEVKVNLSDDRVITLTPSQIKIKTGTFESKIDDSSVSFGSNLKINARSSTIEAAQVNGGQISFSM